MILKDITSPECGVSPLSFQIPLTECTLYGRGENAELKLLICCLI